MSEVLAFWFIVSAMFFFILGFLTSEQLKIRAEKQQPQPYIKTSIDDFKIIEDIEEDSEEHAGLLASNEEEEEEALFW